MATAPSKGCGYANGILNDSQGRCDSAKQKPEAYQLPRDRQESLRLNKQHAFVQDLNDGQLTHSCIPTAHIAAIADVACGTGVWLMDYASRLTSHQKIQLVGFDISSSQFPHVQSNNVKFVVHNMIKSFPEEYHNTFDLVNIRLVVAAVPVADLEKTILNILDILKPGGYLQWLDADASEIWSLPFNAAAQAFLLRILEEKAARGLSLCFSQDVLRTVVSLSTTISSGSAFVDLAHAGDRVNLALRSSCPCRLLTYDPLLIWKHTSADVRAAGHKALSAAYRSMLKKAAVDARLAADRVDMSQDEVTRLSRNAERNEMIIAVVEAEEQAGAFQWQWSLTWIVVQKAVIVGKGDDWLNATHGSERIRSLRYRFRDISQGCEEGDIAGGWGEKRKHCRNLDRAF